MADARGLGRTDGRPFLAGLAAGCAVLAALALAPGEWRESRREALFDRLLAAAAPWRAERPAPPVAIVDIDSASLRAVGAWPWPRDEIAKLAAAVLAAEPKALALDIVIAGPDERSPAALARSLGAAAGRPDIAALAETLADGDRAIAAAIADRPVTLGYVLDPLGDAEPPPAPVLRQGGAALGPLWSGDGLSGPPAGLGATAAVASLPGDADGVVRRAPLFVASKAGVLPGLAAEALRLGLDASGFLLADARLRLGPLDLPLPADGMLRLAPAPPGAAPLRAADLLAGRADAGALKGAIVILGGSAPELGALRPSLVDPLTPPALIHAMAVRQLAAGIVPIRPGWASWGELALAALAIIAGAALAMRLRPLMGAGAAAAGLAALGAGAVLAAAGDRLLDLTLPAAGGAASYAAAALAAFAATRAREARLRRRFEQHLAPGVVERIVADPAGLKLSGERRVVTALFTDIEGFTATAAACAPEELIAALDGYFDGVAAIVTEHGGMIDKFVGDAVHAFFNMPLDLADHATRAVACAVEIASWSEAYGREELPRRIGLGRTRIGVESGEAVVGDVGRATKLDYTAHGSVVNTAARLEAMNKELGTAICIGPGAAALCKGVALRPLGERDLRGLGRLALFTPEAA